MEFCRQEYWSGLPFPSSGDLPDTGSKPWSLALQADSLPYKPPGKTILEDPLGTSHQKFFSKKYFANIKIMKKSCGLCCCQLLPIYHHLQTNTCFCLILDKLFLTLFQGTIQVPQRTFKASLGRYGLGTVTRASLGLLSPPPPQQSGLIHLWVNTGLCLQKGPESDQRLQTGLDH